MSEELFNLVFSGELVKGSQEEAVKANLVRLFKLAPEQVDKMFSGKVITIKKNIDADIGRKLRAKFKQAGALCRLEPFSTTSVSSGSSPGADQAESKSEVSTDTSSSVSRPAVFKVPEDPAEEEPAAEPDTASAETKDSMEIQPGNEDDALPQAKPPADHSPAVFAIPDDPVEEEPAAEPDSVSAEAKDSMEIQPCDEDDALPQAEPSADHSPAVFAIPDDPVEEEPATEPDSASAETKDDVEAQLNDESESAFEIKSDINNVSPVSEASDTLEEAVEEVAEESLSNENTDTFIGGLTIAPPGADVLEGYKPPEPPPPPNVDGMSIAPAGTEILEVKKVVKPVEVDISGLSLVMEES